MANKLADLQASLGARPKAATTLSASTSLRATPKRRTLGRSRALGGAVDYTVPGIVAVIQQPTRHTCWATVATIMLSWKEQQSIPIETALQRFGQKWLDLFKADQTLAAEDKPAFLASAGLVSEYPQSLTIEGWQALLRTYGPVWVTTDESRRKKFAIHARILVGIKGDGTPAGTSADIVDPGSGTRYTEQFDKFLEKYEREVANGGKMRIQIAHWQRDAGVSVAKSLSRAMAARMEPGVFDDVDLAEAEPDEPEVPVGTRRPRVASLAFAFSKKAMTAADAKWAADADSIDYRHLNVAGVSGPFVIDSGVLERLCRDNHFDVKGGQDEVMFGLRGCVIGADQPTFASSVTLSEHIPDHVDNRCVIGVWKRSTRQVACFSASTVPNWKLMELYRQGRGIGGVNLLPTGRYDYIVGTHRGMKTVTDTATGKQTKIKNPKRVQGAFLENDERVILRTTDDLTYTTRDAWDRGYVGDNIHAAWNPIHPPPSTDPDFSSAGCQTLPGTSNRDEPSGTWAQFRAVLGLDNAKPTKDDKRPYVYVLLTGREARLAASGAGSVQRLRYGSSGPEVTSLQLALKAAGAKLGAERIMGPDTVMAWIEYQKKRDQGAADGIVTPADALQLGFDMINGTSVAPMPAAKALGRPTARAFSSDIPLSPSSGGRSIGENALEIGDIILSTTSDLDSRVIRVGTGSPVSHAMVYVGGGQVVEAVGEGVMLHQLEDAVSHSSLAVALRRPGLTNEEALKVRDFAGQQIGKNYDYWGVVDQARFRIDDLRYCALLSEPSRSKCRGFYGRVDLGTATNDRFFCSGLVLAAYAAAGVPLTGTPPHWGSPGDVANLRLSNTLNYVGHLKA